MDQDFTELVDGPDFTQAVLAERAVGEGYRGAYDTVLEWHRESGHVGRFEHCHIRPCYDVVRGGSW